MALDVGIKSGKWRRQASPCAAFEVEAYYWYLHPRFKALGQSHGKYIDLYGVQEFSPAELSLIDGLLAAAEVEVSEQPASWKVHVGTQTKPVEKELHVEVRRSEFLDFLRRLRDIAKQCRDTGGTMIFLGD